MREIKFRAWHSAPGKIKPVIGLELRTMEIRVEEDEWWHGRHPQVVLMQYTGLKDRDGEEIYEGDIVTDIEYLGEVVFHDRWYEVGTHSGKLAWCVFNKSTGEYIPLGDCRDEETWDIVGNIYENPELLAE